MQSFLNSISGSADKKTVQIESEANHLINNSALDLMYILHIRNIWDKNLLYLNFYVVSGFKNSWKKTDMFIFANNLKQCPVITLCQLYIKFCYGN
jgi:hypothetical protein